MQAPFLFAYWCVLIAALMPLALAAYAKFAGAEKMPPEDNARPREWLAQTEGGQKRAHWAQLNALEAFPPFAAAVIIAGLTGASAVAVNILALLFIVFRIAYSVCYIRNLAAARSMIWGWAMLFVVLLYVVAALA